MTPGGSYEDGQLENHKDQDDGQTKLRHRSHTSAASISPKPACLRLADNGTLASWFIVRWDNQRQ